VTANGGVHRVVNDDHVAGASDTRFVGSATARVYLSRQFHW
jgi:hypothetical protein